MHWLEWGLEDGGGSRVRDCEDQPIRTGSKVRAKANPSRRGEVVELVEVGRVMVLWADSKVPRPARPSSLRVLLLGTTST